MKKYLFSAVILICSFLYSQNELYYSTKYRFNAGDSINKRTCEIYNKPKDILGSFDRKLDTISILGIVKCKNGTDAIKFYKDNKIYYDDSFSGLIQRRSDNQIIGTKRTAFETLLEIPVNQEDFIINDYKKRDSINIEFAKNKEIKSKEAAEKYNNFPCESISYSKDKFTGEKMWETQYNEFITIEKHIKNASTAYYFSLFYYDSFLTIPPKNTALILLFSDGTKLTKYDDVNVDYIDSDKGYQYHFFTSLNSNDLKILGSKKITDYKLYIFSSEFDKVASERLMKQTKCLVSKK